MGKKKMLTTGDVAALLSPWLSRSTVSRYFDGGRLSGVRNPITGRRMISHESVTKFAKAYGIEIQG